MSTSHAPIRAAAISTVAAITLLIGACTGAGAGAGATPAATQTAAASSLGSPTAATAAPTASPTPEASAPIAACAFNTTTFAAPSDRLVNVIAKAGSSVDTLTFVFQLKGPVSESGATPTAKIQEAKPPFSQAGSGKGFTVKGDRYLQVVFDGMTIADADGTPVLMGSALELGKFTGLRDAVLFDDFEGVLGWLVGASDPVCITAGVGAPNEVVLMIAHN